MRYTTPMRPPYHDATPAAWSVWCDFCLEQAGDSRTARAFWTQRAITARRVARGLERHPRLVMVVDTYDPARVPEASAAHAVQHDTRTRRFWRFALVPGEPQSPSYDRLRWWTPSYARRDLNVPFVHHYAATPADFPWASDSLVYAFFSRVMRPTDRVAVGLEVRMQEERRD
jgi:hypothetical protein